MEGNITTIKKGSKSFYFAGLFLPREMRRNLGYLYQVLRKADDIVDNCIDCGRRFEDIRDEVQKVVYDRQVMDFFNTHKIPIGLMNDFEEGVLSDVRKKEYQSFDELYYYCYGVAGVIGRMICYLMDIDTKDTKVMEAAEKMGVAMQLTNILRDINEDMDRGIVYLPRDEMNQYLVSVENVKKKKVTSEIQSLIEYQVKRTRKYYEDGFAGVKYLPREMRLGIKVSAWVYSGILDKIEKNNYDPFGKRVYLTTLEKILRVIVNWMSEWQVVSIKLL